MDIIVESDYKSKNNYRYGYFMNKIVYWQEIIGNNFRVLLYCSAITSKRTHKTESHSPSNWFNF